MGCVPLTHFTSDQQVLMPRVSLKSAAATAVASGPELKDLTRQIQRAPGSPRCSRRSRTAGPRRSTAPGARRGPGRRGARAARPHDARDRPGPRRRRRRLPRRRGDLRRDHARGLPRLGEAARARQDATDEVFGRRLRVVKRLAGRMPPRLVVAPIQALLQPVPDARGPAPDVAAARASATRSRSRS